jgi:hypothetical protein
MHIALREGLSKRLNEPVYMDEIESLEDFSLDDPNAGHATLIVAGGRLLMCFDFRYNRGIAKQLLKKAAGAHEVARYAHEKNHDSICLDNLFTAAELTANATLLLTPNEALMKSKNHKTTHSQYNRASKLGNVDGRFRDAFNTLSNLRKEARYSTTDEHNVDVEEMLATVGEMISEAEVRIAD